MRSALLIIFTLLSAVTIGQKKLEKSGNAVPSINIYNLNGETVNLKKFSEGKVTFIDFWFIPCGPCFVEMNMLHKLYAKYKNNPNINFITITITDSAFVRPLTENRHTLNNDTYEYFKQLSLLKTFSLPVFFIEGVSNKMTYFKKQKSGGFSGKSDTSSSNNNDSRFYSKNLFGFAGFPAIFIYDKKGNLVYKEIGFTTNIENKRRKEIESLLDSKLL